MQFSAKFYSIFHTETNEFHRMRPKLEIDKNCPNSTKMTRNPSIRNMNFLIGEKLQITKLTNDDRTNTNDVTKTNQPPNLPPELQNMVPGLFDPAGISKNRSEEAKARGRDVEIKNGRLAMIGIAGMYFAASVDGSVPFQPPC